MSRRGSLFAQLVNEEAKQATTAASVDSHQSERAATHTVERLPIRPMEQPATHEPASRDSEARESPASRQADTHQPDILDIQAERVARELATKPPAVERQRAKREVVDSRSAKPVERHGDRHRPTRTAFNNRLDPELVRRIKHFCIERRLEQQEFTELAAIHFMDAVESEEGGKGAIVIAPDTKRLMMKYKTDPAIINLYLHYNDGNQWKPADDRIGQKYNMVDIRQIELAFIHTQFNARFKKINSFAYYEPEIEANLEIELGNETLDIMLKQHKRRWQEAKGGN